MIKFLVFLLSLSLTSFAENREKEYTKALISTHKNCANTCEYNQIAEELLGYIRLNIDLNTDNTLDQYLYLTKYSEEIYYIYIKPKTRMHKRNRPYILEIHSNDELFFSKITRAKVRQAFDPIVRN